MKRTFDVDIWDCKVHLCTTKESFKKLTKDSDIPCDCICSYDGRDAAILINLDTFKDLNESSLLRSISHESNHASIAILNTVGVKIDIDNQEALCYTQDYIFSMCYKIIKQQMTKS